MRIEIPLTQGQVAIIDEADLPIVSLHKWYAAKKKRSYYAETAIAGTKPQRKIMLHRLLLGVIDDPTIQIDHEDGNGLHNWRDNIRRATHQQNRRNMQKTRGKSKYKGVQLTHNKSNPWKAVIGIGKAGRSRHLGYFATEEEAARAYDTAATADYGEFARLNFPIKEKSH